jgi:Ca-activated chloride channel family protein
MSFSNPDALFLLLLLPVFIVVGWPRLAYRRRRDVASLSLRLILVTLVILGLSGIQVEHEADRLAIVFLVDASDSISPAMQSTALEYVRAAAETMGDRDQAALVVFGADALVDVPMTNRLEVVQLGSEPNRLNTDLADAMRLGLALFPADTARRMVILSDGRQTVGNAEEVARLAAATGVQIDYVALTGTASAQPVVGPEMLVSKVDVPATANRGERFDLTATLYSNYSDGQAEVRVLSGGRVIYRRDVTLQQGNTSEVFEIVAPNAGFVDFQVVVDPRTPDTFYQNNQLSAFTEVVGPPRVLLVTSDPREIESLRAVLEESGLQVDVQDPHDLPIGLAALSSYDSIVLANVSATDLTQDRMTYLQAYVRDLGGGLIVIGGPDSYGVGGYFQTPLEETLPVEMRIRDQKRVPQLTMLFVIDRSGSMEMSGPSGVTNLELAKEAVVRSFDLLNDTDRTGVLSFDVNAQYVIPVQPVGGEANRENLRALVGSLRPGGGTSIRQAMVSAEQVLKDDPSDLKHIILLTDGGSDPSDIPTIVSRMYQDYGITTSVVAIGQDYARWLQDVAILGNGQFHLAYDVSTIPAIFTAETVLATRSYVFEQDFTPAITAQSPIIAGLDAMPPLKGYVATTEKSTATVILRGPEDDPILATWQYGLGRSLAFTSDATSRWAVNWLGWDGYADFWNQAVRWTITKGINSNVEAHVVPRGKQAALVVDARDSQGDYLNGLQLKASVLSAQLDRTELSLHQVAPGRYEADFTPTQEGAYFITVAGSTPQTEGPAAVPVVQTTGWVLSYSAEYRVDEIGTGADSPLNLLKRIASVTGGTSLGDAPKSVFLHNLSRDRAAQPVWPLFVLAALLLLPFDVAIRRLVITRRDLQAAWSAVAAPFKRGPILETSESTAHLGRLRDAKGRARLARREDQSAETAEPLPKWRIGAPRPKPRRDAPKPAAPSAPSAPPSKTQSEPAPQEGSLASRLLEHRKSSQKQDKS